MPVDLRKLASCETTTCSSLVRWQSNSSMSVPRSTALHEPTNSTHIVFRTAPGRIYWLLISPEVTEVKTIVIDSDRYETKHMQFTSHSSEWWISSSMSSKALAWTVKASLPVCSSVDDKAKQAGATNWPLLSSDDTHWPQSHVQAPVMFHAHKHMQ